ncbi:putative T7SS-secreted protein [Streptomyces formicae]|uniref:Tox-PL domain-containing protein n=1 Tax=Streptomyces formicae TaxID=1616117 RepID=A0ABY3WM34_9ACTN|nr:toxin glutamine deamidase domain-containing protein [Streptomyces formicae]UNM11630.1 hypothetical protein J4032_08810 [Streptomyces formicae]
MGLGDLVGGIKDGVKDGLNTGLGIVEDGIDAGKKALGEGVDWTTDRIGDGLEYVGAEGVADKVEDWGDDVASDLGASVREQQLGETDQANELIHGKPERIRESAGHLKDFQTAFDKVGQGMRKLDSSHWKGEAAEAFREKFAMQPTKWLQAADACEAAGQALLSYAETVVWAQKKAQEALDLHAKGKDSSAKAVDAYNTKVDAYNAALKDDRDPGPVPPPFSDPGKADRERAHELLDEARRQRNEAAETARKAIDAAMAHAPEEPPPLDRAVSTALDANDALGIELLHVAGGVVKGTAGIVNFARGLNPLDIYNLTHPAQYLQNVNMTLAGLVSTAAHPERIPGALIDSFKKDPSEGLGRLIPELIGTKGLGAGKAGLRVAAKEGLEEAAEGAAKTAPTKWEFLSQPTSQVSERAIHADSVQAHRAKQFLDEEFPWLKDVNNTDMPGYTDNCSHNVVTVDRRLDGIEVSAAPKQAGDHIPPEALGLKNRAPGQYDQVSSYDDIIRDLNNRGDGARSVVYISRPDGTAHVFNALKTDHGVVFLDGQSGTLGRLEQNVNYIGHIPYR